MHLPSPERLITLTTDFGLRDGYAGAMKGVIRQTAAQALVEDVTHDIPPGDIRAGAWALRTAVPFYPRGTVHVAVIDPGVGTSRHAMVAVADGQFLIGPDNGLFSWLFSQADIFTAWRLSDRSWRPARVSNTFHGRDLFAHAAALLVQEGDLSAVCGERVDPVIEPWATVKPAPGEGRVVHTDHFGNIVTNIRMPHESGASGWKVELPRLGLTLQGLHRTYGDVDEGECLALVGSHDFLEIAVRRGSAAQKLGIAPDELVRVFASSE